MFNHVGFSVFFNMLKDSSCNPLAISSKYVSFQYRLYLRFFFTVTLHRNQFIHLPHELINWFLYGEIVDGYEVYLILTRSE